MISRILILSIVGLSTACSTPPAATQVVRPSPASDSVSAVGLASVTNDAVASTNCDIKGNISKRGEKIYHTPSGQYWGRTQIDQSKGERWFCSPGEARAAGWRAAKR
jgi:hypothetical protein